MSELLERRQALELLMNRFREGRNPEELKEELNRLAKATPVMELAEIEGRTSAGMKRLCDVHLAVFKEAVEKQVPLAPPGHPVHILMEEHKILLQFAMDIRASVNQVGRKNDFGSAAEPLNQVSSIVDRFKESTRHFMREGNILFPYLEKHRLSQPSSAMWNEHNKIRELKKHLYKTIDERNRNAFGDFAKRLDDSTASLVEMLSSHFYREYNILFVSSLGVIKESEWREIRFQFDEVGYCSFTPELATKPFAGQRAY